VRPALLFLITFAAFTLAVTETMFVRLGPFVLAPLLLMLYALKPDVERAIVRLRGRR
jgi:hypothetical protein